MYGSHICWLQMRELAKGALIFFCGAVAGWFIEKGLDLMNAMVQAQPETIKIDIGPEQRCLNGKLTIIRTYFENPNLALTNGADQLTICDTEALETAQSDAPRKLASKYTGCLRWDGWELIMLRASDAVCALPNEAGYICDGTKARARTFPGSRAIGIGQEVPLCPGELLRRFGFIS